MVNTQVMISATVTVGLIYQMRVCEWTTFLCCVVLPGVLYALLAE